MPAKGQRATGSRRKFDPRVVTRKLRVMERAWAQGGKLLESAIDRARAIAEARAPVNMASLEAVAEAVLAGKKMPINFRVAVELAKWELEIAGIKRAERVEHDASPALSEFMTRWEAHASRERERVALTDGGRENAEVVEVDEAGAKGGGDRGGAGERNGDHGERDAE